MSVDIGAMHGFVELKLVVTVVLNIFVSAGLQPTLATLLAIERKIQNALTTPW